MHKKLFEQSTLKMRVLFFLYVFCGTPSISQPHFQFFLGNNKPINQIGVVYGRQLGINPNNGNNGNSNNSSIDPYIVNHDVQLGIQAFQKFKINEMEFHYGATVALGSSDILFEDGIGVFVEPISVKSLNLEFEPEVTLNYSALDNITFFGGISQSIVWTNDSFELGSWKIKERLNFNKTYQNLGIKYEAVKNRFLIEAKLYRNNDSEFFSLRLLVPVQGK